MIPNFVRVHAEITELPKCISCKAKVIINPNSSFFIAAYPELNKLIGVHFFEIIDEYLVTDEKIKTGLEHHFSYLPEIKRPVCLDCHFSIHFTNKYLNFKPKNLWKHFNES